MEGHNFLPHMAHELQTENRAAATTANSGQQWANSTTNLKLQREEKFRVVADSVFYKGQRVNFRHGPVAPPSTEQMLVHESIASVSFHVEEAMNKLVFDLFMAEHK